MAEAPHQKTPEPLDRRARELVSKKYGVKDAFVAYAERGVLRKTNEIIHRFRVGSLSNANARQHVVLLNEAGDELGVDRFRDRDVLEFPAPAIPTAPLASVIAPAPIRIDPSENHLALNQGNTHDETLVVTIPPAASVPKADVYFLADTTGSMEAILTAVQAGANKILAALNGLGLDLMFGVGNYKDFPKDHFAFQHQVNPTNVAANVTNAINAWAADGGGDTPEGQLLALDRLAEPPAGTIGWRASAKRLVVWFGDAPAHDPICTAISGVAANITEASVTAKLVAENISVLAVSVSNPGLDADPRPISFDYHTVCGAPGGAAGQATRIANATGGQFTAGIDASSIVNTIIDLVKTAVSQINSVRLVASGATAPFVTAITPQAGYGPLSPNREHKLDFKVTFAGAVPCTEKEQVFNGTLDVVADERVTARKRVEIKVPACKPTYGYDVKFVCGTQAECPCECAPVRPGIYATEINIYNFHGVEVEVEKRFVPLVLAGAPSGREPRAAKSRSVETVTLPAYSATMDDCCRIGDVLLGGPAHSTLPLTIGFLTITSSLELSVTAVYTASDLKSGSISIRVEQIHGRKGP